MGLLLSVIRSVLRIGRNGAMSPASNPRRRSAPPRSDVGLLTALEDPVPLTFV
jgi:hypothetical protein